MDDPVSTSADERWPRPCAIPIVDPDSGEALKVGAWTPEAGTPRGQRRRAFRRMDSTLWKPEDATTAGSSRGVQKGSGKGGGKGGGKGDGSGGGWGTGRGGGKGDGSGGGGPWSGGKGKGSGRGGGKGKGSGRFSEWEHRFLERIDSLPDMQREDDGPYALPETVWSALTSPSSSEPCR